MRHVLTREQLYDMIWERAVSKVAPELGISDVALRKQCVKHAIPLPDATYWGRLHAGRPIKRKPLSVAPNGVSVRIPVMMGAHSTRWWAQIPRDRGRAGQPTFAWAQGLS